MSKILPQRRMATKQASNYPMVDHYINRNGTNKMETARESRTNDAHIIGTYWILPINCGAM